MMRSMKNNVLLSFVLLVLSSIRLQSSAFVVLRTSSKASLATKNNRVQATALQERRWNFNEGQAPWGFKKNAEIWNGRVAQMAFVIVILQEVIQGKGVIDGIREGDPVNIAIAAGFAVTALGLTGYLALKGDDDYVGKDMGRR